MTVGAWGMVLAVTALAYAVVALVLEGRTIGTCVAAGLAGSGRRLTRLGGGFLFSEAWVVALLGLVHAAMPRASHAVFAVVWAPLMAYVAGWMARDAALWLGPRVGRGRALVAVAATAQVAAAAWAMGLVVVAWAGGGGFRGVAGVEPATAATLPVAVVAPVLLVVVGAVQLVAWRRVGVRHGWFEWG
ncbi:hypothetical protein [Mariniluteicoccus flavus]